MVRVFSASILIVLIVAGCGGSDRPKLTQVSGTVKFKGQPQEGAVVTFVTDKSPRSAVGVCNAQGEFKLTTFDTDDGALPGSHIVTISKPVGVAGNAPKMASPEDYAKMMSGQGAGNTKPPGQEASASSLPAKYADPKLSGLTRDVIAGESNVFNFDLTE